MAEAVASGFGITTFGFQIGMRLYELRGLYKEFSAVPADVDALLVECARFARIIADVESQPNLVTSCRTSSTVFDECRTSCKAVLGVLDGIAQDLKSRTSKSKVKGSIKALLRKDELSKLKEQLRTTKEDFLIAWQIVNRSVHTHSP